MTWFIFIGDMFVMLFMTVLVVWVSAGVNRTTLDYSARIPLGDDVPGAPGRPTAEVRSDG